MNKITLFSLLPFSLILAGCAPSTPKITPDTQTQQAQKLAQIIESGGSAFCTVTNLADNTSTEMTISGKKMKIVGAEMSEGKKGTMINDSVYVYSWEEGQNTGFKMKLSTEEEKKDTQKDTNRFEARDPEVQASTYDDETKYKMDCNKRNIAESEFTPPAGINFIDPSQMQNLSPKQLQDLFPQKDEK